ncbi:MAG: hypothetical protein ACYTGB_01430 [Planctomycetota bacterium]|jgi:hypothetical protein
MDPSIIGRNRLAIDLTTWRLLLTVPSVLAEGETFTLRATAFSPDGMPDAGFPLEIRFEDPVGVEGLPEELRFDPSLGGHAEVSGLKAVGPDRALIRARPKGSPQPLAANPAWVFPEPPYRVYWGDLHVHTTHSNCIQWACKDPQFCMEFARAAAHLDFCAAADHLRGLGSDPSRWSEQQRLVRELDSAGSFVPLLAFESSHKTGFGGDINAYFLGSEAPFFWLDREDMRGNQPEVSLRQLWDFLDGTGEKYFTVPHHTGRSGKYRSYDDPDYDAEREPLFEVYSGWGSSERRRTRFPLHAGNTDRPAYFVDALKAGCRYGAIASSDDHTTTPGGESGSWTLPAGRKGISGYRNQGLAAVFAPDLSRESLWKSLTARRCYGTTLARTLLDVRIGDLSMGESALLGADDPLRKSRRVRVRALSADGRCTVTLVRNGVDVAAAPLRAETGEVAFEGQEPLEKVALRGARHYPGAFAVYYVRLEDSLGQTQWSSPIWLDLE